MTVLRTVIAAIAMALAACGRSPAGDAPAAARPAVPPTFTKDVAPILFANCAPCHRPGQVAPFSLLTYADARERSEKIATATRTRHMPPWLPMPGFGTFLNERRLTEADVATIQAWAGAGAPEGDPAVLPVAPVFTDAWQLGTPDLVVTAPKPFTLQPGRQDVFRNIVLPVALPAGRYVRAVEFRPGRAAIVHHAVISLDRTRASRRRDGADGQPGYDGMITQGAQSPDGHFLGWTPGRGPIVAPDGLPWRLDPHADLVVQLHLLPQKTADTVQPSLALYFTDTPPARLPAMVKLSSKAIDIAAGDAAYTVRDAYTLPVDVDVLSVYPHAHYLGKSIQAMATLPDGSTSWLLRIDDWDFHWQQDYRYATPISLPRGTTVSMTITYDNSAHNHHNPSKPPIAVVYGPNSSDEMGDLWLQMLPKSEADLSQLISGFAAHERETNILGAELVIRRTPASSRNQLFLGSSYAEAGRAAEAIPHLEEALRLDPKSAMAHSYLGAAWLAQRRLADALGHLRQAVALAPDDERMHFNLGNALNLASQPADAARSFERALQINPDFAEAHDNLGIYLFGVNRTAEALAHLRRAAELAPASADILSDLGGALADSGDVAGARVALERAVALQPNHPTAKANLQLLNARARGGR